MPAALISRRGWLAVAAFLAWSAVFAVAYAQSPLYTSNQNQYFLHGLAQAGVGDLNQDWLANTRDPTPVFSALVAATYAVTHSGFLYYVYYGLLMGVYLAGMFGILDLLFDLRKSKAGTLAFLAIFIAVHSAALRFVLSNFVSADATFLLEGGVAGQRLLGQVFQPSAFGVFLILSLYLFLRGQRYWAILPLAVAVTFHSTYLLAAALLTLAYMLSAFRQGGGVKQPVALGALALVAVLPVVIYTAVTFGPTSASAYRSAQNILVHYRIPQHAVISAWLDWTVAVQAVIVLAALYLLRKTRLFTIYAVLLAGCVLLTALQAVTGSNLLALLFPWRISTLLVPLGTCTLLAAAVSKLMEAWKDRKTLERWIIISSLAGISLLLVVGAIRFQLESLRKLSDPARPMMEYVAAHRSPGDVYLIPSKMVDFRLVTGAAIYSDFNSIPYRDSEVLVWYRRVQWVIYYYGGSHKPCQELKDMAAREGVDYAVVETGNLATWCNSLPTPYQDSAYTIYALTSNP